MKLSNFIQDALLAVAIGLALGLLLADWAVQP